jgi:hypothetical protein
MSGRCCYNNKAVAREVACAVWKDRERRSLHTFYKSGNGLHLSTFSTERKLQNMITEHELQSLIDLSSYPIVKGNVGNENMHSPWKLPRNPIAKGRLIALLGSLMMTLAFFTVMATLCLTTHPTLLKRDDSDPSTSIRTLIINLIPLFGTNKKSTENWR